MELVVIPEQSDPGISICQSGILPPFGIIRFKIDL